MNPTALALRNVLLGRRALAAALVVAASLSVVDLFAGHVTKERARLEYQAVIAERLGHLSITRIGHGGETFDADEAARINRFAAGVDGVALVAVQPLSGGGRIAKVAVYLADAGGEEQVRAALAGWLRQAGIAASVQSWRESSSADSAARTKLVCAAMVALAVAAAAIGAVTSMNALERRNVLATLRALGMRPAGVFAVVAAEALWIAGFAAALSLAADCLLAWAANRAALSLSAHPDAWILPECDLGRMLLAVAAVLGVAMLAALSPALKAARTDPACGLRRDPGHPGW
ncbi:ABC transporter permease [Massilia horti]|uniref:ABC transporter permease n=1 Tax=Massilia horti TaxID=2562153 RepID=A0A4Y9SL85_9BURK|nr:ABC transporter permease [Massilia horti]TFW27452.1 ABC transporter permease [Massilia horti]